MSTEQKNNHSNNGTRNAGAVLGAVSVLVALFYVSADSFGYKLPDWLTFIILSLLVLVFIAILTSIISFFFKNIPNPFGKEKFHWDVILFTCFLIIIAIISMFAFKCVNSNCEIITFVIIAAIFYIAQLCKTSMKNKYDETKIDLDYMQKRNRYVIYNINDPNAVGEIKKFTEKKEELKYYNSMKNNYEAITILFAFASLIMGFSKLG